MLIEKTTIQYFNEQKERERILNVFTGEEQKHLLGVLDAFIAGDMAAFLAKVVALPSDCYEYLAEPVYDTAMALHLRNKCHETFAKGIAKEVEIEGEKWAIGAKGNFIKVAIEGKSWNINGDAAWAEGAGDEPELFPKFVVRS